MQILTKSSLPRCLGIVSIYLRAKWRLMFLSLRPARSINHFKNLFLKLHNIWRKIITKFQSIILNREYWSLQAQTRMKKMKIAKNHQYLWNLLSKRALNQMMKNEITKNISSMIHKTSMANKKSPSWKESWWQSGWGMATGNHTESVSGTWTGKLNKLNVCKVQQATAESHFKKVDLQRACKEAQQGLAYHRRSLVKMGKNLLLTKLQITRKIWILSVIKYLKLGLL